MKIPVQVLVFSFLSLLLTIISRTIPMFWDMSNITWAGDLIYDSNFGSFIFPNADIDQGAAPVYSTYLALLWKLFGRSLAVSHYAIAPFVIGIIFQFYTFSIKFITQKQTWLALLLLFIEPTILTQAYLAGVDLVFCFLFLLGVNSAIENRKILLSLAVLFILLLRLRGFTIFISVFMIDYYLNHGSFGNFRNFIRQRFLVYFIPILILAIWFAVHYYHTGWILISDNVKGFHTWAGTERILRNLFYILWKICDFGRIFLVAVIVILFLRTPKNETGKKMIVLMLLTIIPYVVFFAPLTYPVSHRHFMITYFICITAFVFFINTLKKKHCVIISSVIILGLATGNSWIYPERFGNGWDSSMKVYPYFQLKNNLDNYIKTSGIDPSTVGAKAPMDFDLHYSKLDSEHFGYRYIKNESISNFSYVVQSNICNTFTPAELNELNKQWSLEKEWKSWPVYIKFFRRNYGSVTNPE